ncbi:MAG: proprotein convertase P-domain-containing protein, partial [Saprospiraceae bacterium]
MKEYQNATQNLTCNDNVQVSLDENCEATIGADMVLEGGPYGCYDTRYDVLVLNALGGIIPQPLGPAAIGKTYTVKVIDNQTNQLCWGSIIVKDKLGPIIECRDLTIACSEALPAEPAPAFTGPNTMVIENINEPLGEAGAPVPDVHSYDFDYSFYPPGTPVEDVDVIVKLIEHTWLPDLDIVASNPAGDQVDVFDVTGCFGAEFDMDLIFDDEGTGGLTQCADLNAGGARLQCLIAPGVQSNTVLSAFDGTDAGGIWSLTYRDNVTGDDGIIVTAGLIVTANAPAVVPTDNCGSVTVTVEESYIDDSCGGPAGQYVRTWTATDNSGNSESCTQTITLSRPTVAEIEIPANIKWTCTQYDIFPNIIDPTAVHPFIVDCDASSALLDATCYSASCDDLDFSFQDNAGINSTTTGGGCPGLGLDDADVLAVTGSGYPTVNGAPLISICEIGVEHEDIIVQECVGTFKIVRQWTIIDWCSNPIAIRQENQVIKVVDEEAPIIELFGVDGKINSSYGNSLIPALGNLGNPNTTGGCGQAPQNTGGTVFTALVQLPGTGNQFNPDQFTNISLESVLLTINHQHVEDLDIFLKGPSNKVIELSTDNGINGVGYHKTKFVDDTSVPVISNGVASPFTGRYRPEGTFDISCGGFNGTVATLAEMTSNWQADVLGTWELIVFDDDQDNIGEMVEWKLNFSFGDVTIDVYDATASGSIHTICEGSVLVPPIQDCDDNCSGVDHYITELW